MQRVITAKEIKNLYNYIFFKKYKVNKAIGRGTFGVVFEGVNIKNNQKIAIKIEKNIGNDNLVKECSFLTTVQGYGIPKLISFGISGKYYVLIMELLGKSLFQIKKPMLLKDVCIIAIQIIDRLEFIHSKFILHRDIKPTNFLLDNQNESTLYLIDFGVAKKFRSSNTKKHMKFENVKKLTGTIEFSSLNGNLGYTQSRRDELEAVGYLLIYLIKGKLPWITEKKESLERKIIEIETIKKNTTIFKLCENLPEEFAQYINYTRKLRFEQDPDYEHLRNLFKKIMINNYFFFDMKFSWVKTENSDKSNSYLYSKLTSKNNNFINVKQKGSLHIRIYNEIKKSLSKKNYLKTDPQKQKDEKPPNDKKNLYSNYHILTDITNDKIVCNIKKEAINSKNFNSQYVSNNIILSKINNSVVLNKENNNQNKNRGTIINNNVKEKSLKNKIFFYRKLEINQPNNKINEYLRGSNFNLFKTENINKSNLLFNGNYEIKGKKIKKVYFSKVVNNLKLEQEKNLKSNIIYSDKLNKKKDILKKDIKNNKSININYINNSNPKNNNNLVVTRCKSTKDRLDREKWRCLYRNNTNNIIKNYQRYSNISKRYTNIITNYSKYDQSLNLDTLRNYFI